MSEKLQPFKEVFSLGIRTQGQIKATMVDDQISLLIPWP
jgi:hypothetical protein